MTDNKIFLPRFGAVCGVVLALSIGLPGAVEAFTGETAVTSAVIGLGTAFGAPAVLALHGHQAHASGRFGAVAFAANLLGLGLFTGVAFALNLVIFFLEPGQVAPLTQVVVKVASLVFVAGTVLFGVSMVRAKVFPAVPAWGYGISFVLLAVFAALPDTPLSALVHVVCAAVLVWLSVAVWSARPALA
ncbi:hypothetical protein OG205_26475 [Lentzea sp. NBC_00516]|uniref:hypothetical protein n=1 Tax=Lentzea sp. NBC_00516 TaxID=2903582 RepID=UPI002E800866|nr:hypothetical protein [Lentzea sp. NBC_00516]WUD21663.1 hypothetical protein OG205_26475 [Lentzea sp. NBC_00516]